MTVDLDQDRLALAELTCRLEHVQTEASALAERRLSPAMADDRRAARLAELESERGALRGRQEELTERVPDASQVRGPDGTLPADRRLEHLGVYRTRRLEKLGGLRAKGEYLDAILADKAAPKDVRRRARDARASVSSDIEALNAEPSDDELRPEDMCADGVHLERSHGYVWSSTHPAYPCSAWPGQQRIFDDVAKLLFDITARARDQALTRWRLTLYCGHVVERTAHSSYATYTAAGGGQRVCEVCGIDPAFVVEGISLGPSAPPPPPRSSPSKPTPRSRKALERRAEKLEAELAAVRDQLKTDN
jgi:hypothetical protein